VRPSLSGAEERLAVAAAEEKDEPLQVLVQLGDVIGGVADEIGQGGGEAGGVAGQPRLRRALPVAQRRTAGIVTVGWQTVEHGNMGTV